MLCVFAGCQLIIIDVSYIISVYAAIYRNNFQLNLTLISDNKATFIYVHINNTIFLQILSFVT